MLNGISPHKFWGFVFADALTVTIILDFAAAHPHAIAPAGGFIRGVGTAMLYSLVRLARDLGVRAVWGEATENSSAFYEKALGLKSLSDHFFIEGEIFTHCLRKGKRFWVKTP
jgi:hypothetical protein